MLDFFLTSTYIACIIWLVIQLRVGQVNNWPKLARFDVLVMIVVISIFSLALNGKLNGLAVGAPATGLTLVLMVRLIVNWEPPDRVLQEMFAGKSWPKTERGVKAELAVINRFRWPIKAIRKRKQDLEQGRDLFRRRNKP